MPKTMGNAAGKNQVIHFVNSLTRVDSWKELSSLENYDFF